jgi:hypothetical protein
VQIKGCDEAIHDAKQYSPGFNCTEPKCTLLFPGCLPHGRLCTTGERRRARRIRPAIKEPNAAIGTANEHSRAIPTQRHTLCLGHGEAMMWDPFKNAPLSHLNAIFTQLTKLLPG